MQERADYKTRWVGEGKNLAKVSPIPTRFPPDVDEILRAVPNKSQYIRDAVIKQLRADGLL